MQVNHFTGLVFLLLGILTVRAGYPYKAYRPPPNQQAQQKIHYGPKPVTSSFYKPPPFHSRRPIPPIPIHPPRNPIRPPLRPHFNKPTPPTPPPFPPSWKTHSSFRAPVVKETFHSAPVSPVSYSHDHFLDDDKGPIHTIPAPNLSPADRPHDFPHGGSSSALQAVLNHGHSVQEHGSNGYQVTEDPSVYKPFSGPSYFAPDPDPSLPTVEVTKTIDPHSLPSNGVKPLDVYQQELNDQAHQHFADGGISNSLSSQELYSLLNGLNQQPVMTPELYQQYLQAAAALGQPQQQIPSAYQTVYNAGVLYHRQHYHNQQEAQQFAQNFHPQYETFNYNEQTQEGAYGSDSFPSASSVSVGVKRSAPRDISTDFTDKKTKYLGKNQEEDLADEEVISNQVDYEDEKSTENSDKDTPNSLLNTGYYTTLPNQQTAETLSTLAVAGNINNQIMKSPFSVSEKQKEENNEVKQINIDEKSQNSYRVESNSNRNNEIRKEEEERKPYQYNHNNEKQTIQTSNENKDDEQTFTEDYNEDEILDPSDKDQMVNYHFQNGMTVFDTTYTKNRKEQQKETEQNYEDSENEYIQEESEIPAAKSSNTGKVSSYNTHQNQLPFGAKLRPKRV